MILFTNSIISLYNRCARLQMTEYGWPYSYVCKTNIILTVCKIWLKMIHFLLWSYESPNVEKARNKTSFHPLHNALQLSHNSRITIISDLINLMSLRTLLSHNQEWVSFWQATAKKPLFYDFPAVIFPRKWDTWVRNIFTIRNMTRRQTERERDLTSEGKKKWQVN